MKKENKSLTETSRKKTLLALDRVIKDAKLAKKCFIYSNTSKPVVETSVGKPVGESMKRVESDKEVREALLTELRSTKSQKWVPLTLGSKKAVLGTIISRHYKMLVKGKTRLKPYPENDNLADMAAYIADVQVHGGLSYPRVSVRVHLMALNLIMYVDCPVILPKLGETISLYYIVSDKVDKDGKNYINFAYFPVEI